MKKIRKPILVATLERKLEKTQRRLQRISEEAYQLRMMIAQLKDKPEPYEVKKDETVEKPA